MQERSWWGSLAVIKRYTRTIFATVRIRSAAGEAPRGKTNHRDRQLSLLTHAHDLQHIRTVALVDLTGIDAKLDSARKPSVIAQESLFAWEEMMARWNVLQ